MANYIDSIKYCEVHLDVDEQIQKSVFGFYEASFMGNKTFRSGLLAATNKRLVFFSKKLFGYEMETFAYKNITSIESGKGLLGYKLAFYVSGNKASMSNIYEHNGDAIGLVNHVRGIIEAPPGASKGS